MTWHTQWGWIVLHYMWFVGLNSTYFQTAKYPPTQGAAAKGLVVGYYQMTTTSAGVVDARLSNQVRCSHHYCTQHGLMFAGYSST